MLQNIIFQFNNFIWSCCFLPGLIIIAAVLALRCDWLQFRHFFLCMRGSVGSIFRRSKKRGGISSFQAASTALASTVGTGNIVGTAQALCLGGPGAIFWMWAASFLSMGVKYAEICLASHYRQRNANGKSKGGPMYYIRAGLGKAGRPLSAAYALFAAFAGLSMGNMTQVNSAAASFVSTAGSLSLPFEENSLRLFFGLSLAAAALLIMHGGAAGVSRASSLLVPFMSLVFIGLSAFVLCCRAQYIPDALSQIISEAFSPGAVLGASGGLASGSAIGWGLRRSAFSNEAGLGTAGIAHGLTDTDSPVEEGFWGVFEVFADTTLLCTLTAFVILCSVAELPYGSSPGPELLSQAFAGICGPVFSELFVSCTMLLLAFSSVLAWALYGVQCAEYVFGRRAGRAYQAVFICLTVAGACVSAELVWSLSDLFNALMSVPNMLALLVLSGKTGNMTKAYLSKIS